MDQTPTDEGRRLRTRKPVDYTDRIMRTQTFSMSAVKTSIRKVQTERKNRPNEQVESPVPRARRNRSIAKKLNFDLIDAATIEDKPENNMKLRIKVAKDKGQPNVTKVRTEDGGKTLAVTIQTNQEPSQSTRKTRRSIRSTNEPILKSKHVEAALNAKPVRGRPAGRRSEQQVKLTPVRVVIDTVRCEENTTDSQRKRRVRRAAFSLAKQLENNLSTLTHKSYFKFFKKKWNPNDVLQLKR